jgi:hypothetical protein
VSEGPGAAMMHGSPAQSGLILSTAAK